MKKIEVLENALKEIRKKVPYESHLFYAHAMDYVNEKRITQQEMVESVLKMRMDPDYRVNPDQMMSGNFYHFPYKPLTKDKLEEWDIFPMYMHLHRRENKLVGLNFNHIDPRMRIQLLGELHYIRDENSLNSLMEREKKNARTNNTGVRYKDIRQLNVKTRSIMEVITRRYLRSRILKPPILIPFRYVKLFLLFPLQSFKPKNQPIPIWRKNFLEIMSKRS